MTIITRTFNYEAIARNDIDAVVFQDPFQDEARKAKRNLMVSSFIAVLLASLNLRVTSFLSLQTATPGAALDSSIARGLACLIVLYSLASFTLVTYVDYSAWKFKRERLLVRPYLDLVQRVESEFNVLQEQIGNAMSYIKGISMEPEMRAQIELRTNIDSAAGQLRSICEEVTRLNTEVTPLLAHWHSTINQTTRLTWRLRARFASLWILDIAVPFVFGIAALLKTYDGLRPLLAKLFG